MSVQAKCQNDWFVRYLSNIKKTYRIKMSKKSLLKGLRHQARFTVLSTRWRTKHEKWVKRCNNKWSCKLSSSNQENVTCNCCRIVFMEDDQEKSLWLIHANNNF